MHASTRPGPRHAIPLAVCFSLALTAIIAGCGSSSGNGPAAPSANTSSAPAGTIEPIPAGAVTISANNLQFDADTLSSPAGMTTVVFDNLDSGVPHNIHFHRGTKVTGESVGKTDVENGRTKQTLRMELDAGAYYYQCDVHPNMKGILTAS